jgi:hypothetical protein
MGRVQELPCHIRLLTLTPMTKNMPCECSDPVSLSSAFVYAISPSLPGNSLVNVFRGSEYLLGAVFSVRSEYGYQHVVKEKHAFSSSQIFLFYKVS